MNNKGITLISLVVTIIVLLILAGITIGTIFNDNGIIKKAQEAANATEDSAQNEQEALNGLLNDMDGIINGIGGGATPIIGSINGKVTWSTGSASLELTTDTEGVTIQYRKNSESSWTDYTSPVPSLLHGDKVYARGVKDGETVISEKQFDILDTTPPTVTIASSSSTTNSISATATATDNETGMGANPKYIFYIKKTADPDSTYVEIANSTNASVTKDGLEQNTSYTIKVEVSDVAGNKGQTTKDITISKIADAGDGLVSGAIVASTPVWSNGTASTTLSTDTGLTIQYQINGVDGSWTNGTNVTGLHHKDTVFARLTDGTNYGGEASITILDIVAPSLATISLSGTLGNNGYYRSNVTVAITAGSDGQSGVNQVRYSVSGAQTVNETTTAAGTTSTSITISTDGTSTITAYTIDKAGNVSEAKKQVVNKDSTAPSTASLTTGTVGETSIEVTAKGTDATSGIYSYQFQRSTTSATTGFTTVATQTSTATSYNYTYTGLTSGTTYYLKVIVTDKAGNTKEASATATTKTAGISETNSYVGSYADVDGNGIVDGIIYADLAIGGSGQWYNSNGTYTIPKGSNFKKYTVSGSHTENGFGTKDVIKVSNGSGNERFYVMALKDVDSSIHTWYSNAYGNMSDYASTTSVDFGTGEKNTQTMISKWNSNAYGSQYSRDMWGLSAVQSGTWNGSSGWYVPSRGEWAAFGAAFNITSSNYTSYGLSSYCWSSSQGKANFAWDADFISGYMYNFNVDSTYYVRLGTTF